MFIYKYNQANLSNKEACIKYLVHKTKIHEHETRKLKSLGKFWHQIS